MHMRKILAAAAMSAMTFGMISAPASARTATNQRFVLVFTGRDGSPGQVAAVGPVTGIGSETETDGPSGDTLATLTFAVGQVHVDIAGHRRVSFDPRTCIARPTESGTFTLTGGSGPYAGVTGGGTFSAEGVSIGRRGAQGQCEGPGSGVAPLMSVFVAQLAGNTRIES
jgi:hypothetical protein